MQILLEGANTRSIEIEIADLDADKVKLTSEYENILSEINFVEGKNE